MKRLSRLCILWALGLFTVSAAQPEVAFKAFMLLNDQPRFVVVADGKTSGWLPLASHFGGFAVKAFDPATDTLTLQREGMTQDVHPSRRADAKGKVTAVSRTPEVTAASCRRVGRANPRAQRANRTGLEVGACLQAMGHQVTSRAISYRLRAGSYLRRERGPNGAAVSNRRGTCVNCNPSA